MKKTALATAIVSLLSHAYTSPVFAQNTTTETDETMVVTANRFEQSAKDVIAPVEVVTKEDIEAMQAKSLDEVLRRLPGIQVGKSGGYGQQTSLFVRGTESDHILILMNGIRIGSATAGNAAINLISLNGVERVEYIRGPRTAVYGADAIGGVINIITSTTEEYTSVTGGLGSNNYKQLGAVTSRKVNENLYIKAAVSQEKEDGFSVSSNPTDLDDDGFENTNISLEAMYQFSEAFLSRVNFDYSEGSVEYDPAKSYKDYKNYNIALSNEYKTNKWHSTFVIATNQDNNDNFSYYDNYDKVVFETKRDTVYLNTFYSMTEKLIFGAGLDWYKDDVSNSTDVANFDETTRTNMAGFITGLYQGDKLQVEASLRNDDNQRYGNNSTWQFGAGYEVIETIRLTANTGTAFKAPTFNDLYSPLDCSYGTCYSGNPNLKPEESENYEVAIEGAYTFAFVRVAAYRNNITNLISGSIKENVGKATIEGIELSTSFETGPISHQVSFDWMDPKNEDTGEVLARRAKRSGKWNSSYIVNDFLFDLSYLYQDERLNYSGGDMLDSYSLFDLAGTYFITDSFSVSARIANMFNEEYETAGGYNTQERSYYGTATYKF